MNITELEHKVLAQIAFAEHTTQNGGMPECKEDAVTWNNCVDCTSVDFEIIKGHQLAGVLSSLINKELIDDNGETVGHTDSGFDAFMNGPYAKKEANPETVRFDSLIQMDTFTVPGHDAHYQFSHAGVFCIKGTNHITHFPPYLQVIKLS